MSERKIDPRWVHGVSPAPAAGAGEAVSTMPDDIAIGFSFVGQFLPPAGEGTFYLRDNDPMIANARTVQRLLAELWDRRQPPAASADEYGGWMHLARVMRNVAVTVECQSVRQLQEGIAQRQHYEQLLAAKDAELAASREEGARLQEDCDNIVRALESAEVPDTLPDDPDETPMQIDDRVEWLAEQRNIAEYERDEARQQLAAAREEAAELAEAYGRESRLLRFANDNPQGSGVIDGVRHTYHIIVTRERIVGEPDIAMPDLRTAIQAAARGAAQGDES